MRRTLNPCRGRNVITLRCNTPNRIDTGARCGQRHCGFSARDGAASLLAESAADPRVPAGRRWPSHCHHDAENGYAIDAHPACAARRAAVLRSDRCTLAHLATWRRCITRPPTRSFRGLHAVFAALEPRPSQCRRPDIAAHAVPRRRGRYSRLMRLQRSIQRRKFTAIATAELASAP